MRRAFGQRLKGELVGAEMHCRGRMRPQQILERCIVLGPGQVILDHGTHLPGAHKPGHVVQQLGATAARHASGDETTDPQRAAALAREAQSWLSLETPLTSWLMLAHDESDLATVEDFVEHGITVLQYHVDMETAAALGKAQAIAKARIQARREALVG